MGRTTGAQLACIASVLIVACGGGGGAGPSEMGPAVSPAPSPVPAPGPAPGLAAVATEHEPYWAKGAGVRPNLAHLLGGRGEDGTAVSLDAGEAAWLRQRARSAGTQPQAAKGNNGNNGDNGDNGDNGVRAQAAVQRRTVTGLFTTLFHSASTGSTQVPVNLSLTAIEALAPDGTGGFEVIAATARRADGTYAIAGVPEGAHWLRLGNRYVWTDQPFIDWSFDAFGRADVAFPSAPTKLVLNAANLAAWQTTDTLAWVIPQHGLSLALPLASGTVDNPPRLGETALGAFGFELGSFSGLLDAGKGDAATLNQLATVPGASPYGPVRVLARSLVLPPTTTADGSTTTIDSGFLDIAANARLKLHWKRAAFARHGDAVHPGALASGSFAAVVALELPPDFGNPNGAYSLLEFDATGSSDLQLGPLAYGNPFPADWGRSVDTFVSFTKNYLAPGATVSEPLLRGLSMSVLLDAATRDNAQLTLTPAMTPPRHPQINGKTLFANQLGVGTTPRLSWTAPETGTPGRYFVRVLRLERDGTRSRLAPVATLVTAETAMTLPPALLAPGQLYVVTIAAIATPGSPVTQPNRTGLPFAFATTMSAIVSP